MQLHVSNEASEILEHAQRLSAHQGKFHIGVEHLYGAILDKAESLPARFRDRWLEALMKVSHEVVRGAWRGSAETAPAEVFHTPRCVSVIQQAEKIALRRGQGALSPGCLLLAILADCRSAPSRAMDAMRMDRGACIKALTQGLDALTPGVAAPNSRSAQSSRQAGAVAETPAAAPTPTDVPKATEAQASEGVNLEALTRDLSQLAQQGKLEPAIGRDQETFEILQILARKSKNNVMIVGEAGVGKTQIVEGMACRLAQNGGHDGTLPNFRVLELNITALMAGTQYRGAFEEKVLALLERLRNADDLVLFIDEAHLIMGAGAADGDGMDLANLLKPALARGELRCIGATTIKEYRKFVERDPAIERRFQMVRVEELPEDATHEVLKHVAPSLESHHRVRITEEAIEAAVTLTQRHMPNRCFPDKAIDVLDQACARFRLKVAASQNNPGSLDNTLLPSMDIGVTPHEIRKVISRICAIPIEKMTAEERMHLGAVERKIKAKLIGQDEAVAKAVAAIKKSRAGLADPNRPDAVLLFLGPSGVGKTQLAKMLAHYVFGAMNHLLTFDMSEYIEEHAVSRLLGAPPGYVGSEEEGRLTGAVRNTPFSILLFDEIEKAHPRIFDIFLPIFDEGRLKDARGRDVSFKNCIIIMTSNIGADILLNADEANPRAALIDALRQHFRPEFINRVDDIVPFYPLLREDVRAILRHEVNAVRKRLQDRQLRVRMYQRAYEYLMDKGYSPEFGARELRRVVDQEITIPVSDMILRGIFEEGDVINVMEDNGSLVFVKGNSEADEELRRERARA